MSGAGVLLIACALALVPGTARSSARIARMDSVDLESDQDAGLEVETDSLAVAATFDLLAACLHAGLPVAQSLAVVATGAPGPLAPSLRRVSDLLSLGADPDLAWSEAAGNPATESLARMARRSAQSGSSLAASMQELAEHCRAEAEDTAAAGAERAGVLISGPLGLCFLPAFIALGIVPVVIGLASSVLGDGLL